MDVRIPVINRISRTVDSAVDAFVPLMRNPGTMAPSYPTVIAHRGASTLAAEHTAAAYRAAIESGAEGLECDVRLTADGHLVCVHDPRIDRTSTGRGRVSNQTLEQLQEHNFGSWWNPADHPHDGGEDILTLVELLEMALAAPQHIELAIETKHPTRYGGYTEQVLVQTLERFGLADGAQGKARVMSFSAIALRRMRDLAPRIQTVYLMDKVPMLQRFGPMPFGSGIAGPSVEILQSDPAQVARWQEAGYAVHVWTVDTREQLSSCMASRVDVVITNTPHEVLAWRDDLWAELGGRARA